jgi:hypothetical protein
MQSEPVLNVEALKAALTAAKPAIDCLEREIERIE